MVNHSDLFVDLFSLVVGQASPHSPILHVSGAMLSRTSTAAQGSNAPHHRPAPITQSIIRDSLRGLACMRLLDRRSFNIRVEHTATAKPAATLYLAKQLSRFISVTTSAKCPQHATSRFGRALTASKALEVIQRQVRSTKL